MAKLRYKAGYTVKVKPREFFETLLDGSELCGNPENELDEMFVDGMLKYCGQSFIVDKIIRSCIYVLQDCYEENCDYWYFSDWMLEDDIK